MRKPIIAGNWKMNKCVGEAVELVSGLKGELSSVNNVDIVVAPVFTALHKVGELIKNSNIFLSAQNTYWESSGAYTGEISPNMLLDVGCTYVIIGHSERRTYFCETDEGVNKKIAAAQKAGLIPIVCIGETLKERESEKTFEVVASQIRKGLANFTDEQVEKLVIAYEPIWAIGTGKTATPEQAEEVHAFIRKTVSEIFSQKTSEIVRIQYGGSANPGNAKELMSKENIDGLLVGGASLKVDFFAKMVKETQDVYA